MLQLNVQNRMLTDWYILVFINRFIINSYYFIYYYFHILSWFVTTSSVNIDMKCKTRNKS